MEKMCEKNQRFNSIITFFQRYKTAFLSTIIFGFIAHGYVFTNKLLVHDEVTYLFAKGETISSGRWALELLSCIFPDFSMQWLYGIMSVAILAVTVCLICKIFDIEQKILQGFLGALIIVFPSLTDIFLFMFTSTAYATAIFLSVLGVVFLDKKKVLYYIFAVLCFAFSLGIYQGFFFIAVGLVIIQYIQKILSDATFKECFIDGIKRFVLLVVSGGVYYVINLLVIKLSHVAVNEYYTQNLKNISRPIYVKIFEGYQLFAEILVDGFEALIPYTLSKVLHLVCFVSIVIVLVCWIIKTKKKLWEKLLLLFLLGVFPLSITGINVILGTGVTSITGYSFISFYILAIVLLSTQMKNTKSDICIKNIISISLAVIVICNIYSANKVYLCAELEYNNAFSECTQIVTQIKQTPGYNSEKKIAIIGEQYFGEAPEMYDNFSPEFNGLYSLSSLINFFNSREAFMEYYLGFDADYATDEEIDKIMETTDFRNMADYPDYGSVQCIGDYIVVKFSDKKSQE